MPMQTRKPRKRPICKRTNGVQDEDIASLIVETWLGPFLIATTGRGICVAEFAETRKELEEQRQRLVTRRRPSEEPNGVLFDRLREAVQWVESPRTTAENFDAPIDLDPRGTPFQSLVWQALMTIPIGQTRTYAEIARQIGNPTAVRAVANACGANPLAVLIPCHRVIRGDGGLGGYRWGLARKRSLLQRETQRVRGQVESSETIEALPRSKTAC